MPSDRSNNCIRCGIRFEPALSMLGSKCPGVPVEPASPFPSECDLCDGAARFRFCLEHMAQIQPPVESGGQPVKLRQLVEGWRQLGDSFLDDPLDDDTHGRDKARGELLYACAKQLELALAAPSSPAGPEPNKT